MYQTSVDFWAKPLTKEEEFVEINLSKINPLPSIFVILWREMKIKEEGERDVKKQKKARRKREEGKGKGIFDGREEEKEEDERYQI